MNLHGTPEGVQIVRLGKCKPEDFELQQINGKPVITKGPRSGSTCEVVVKAAPRYKFQFDARTFAYHPVKVISDPEPPKAA